MVYALWLETIAAALGLWLTISILWRGYRVDAFRHRLFKIRSALTLLVADGRVSPDDHAYRFLRMSINGMIHRADRFNLLTLILSVRADQWPQPSPYIQWKMAVKSLPADVRQELYSLDAAVARAFGIYLLSGSVIMMGITAGLMVRQLLDMAKVQLRTAIEEASEKVQFRKYENEAFRSAATDLMLAA